MSLLNWVAAARHTAQSERVQWAGILTAAAFLVATLFVLLVAQPTIQVIDGPTYHKIALRLVEDYQFGPIGYPYPLYPIFLAVIYVLGGDYHTVYLVQGLMFASVVGLSYLMARQVAGHVAGIFAALLVMLDASLVGNAGLIVIENLQTILLMLAMVLSLYAIEQEKVRFHGAAGVLWGLATLVKPTTLLWPIVSIPVYLLLEWKRGWLMRSVFLILAFALTLSPWFVRNQFNAEVAAVGVAYSPLLRHVLDEGESKHTIANMGPKFEAVFAEAEERGIERGSLQFELNTLRLLRDRITRSPSAYVAYLWDNFSRFWMEPPAAWPYAVYDGEFIHGYRDAPGYGNHAKLHAVFAVMGLLSLVLFCRQRPRAAFYITVFLLYFAMFHTMTHFIPRYSVPVLPLLLVGAASFPALVMALIKEKLVNYRVLSNVLLATITITLVAGVSAYFLLQRPNYIQEGSFESESAEEKWAFEERIGEPRVPLVVDPYRARDGFRAAVLEIGLDEHEGDTRVLQDVPVWFGGKYRLSFTYLFLEEGPRQARFYVEILEWDIFDEGWKSVRKDFQPVVTNTWTEQEYEFEVGASARAVSIIFGLWLEPGTVLVDNVRLELAASVSDAIGRPYILQDPSKLHTSTYLPLEKWVNTQPEANRTLLLANAGVAQANGWRGNARTLVGAARAVGMSVLLAWVAVAVICVRLRMVELIVRARVLELGMNGAMLLLVIFQAATCYLLLFSHPA